MKLSRRQLSKLIREAIEEDPRARLDLSRLSPEEREKLQRIKNSGDMATYYMLLDTMLQPDEDEEDDASSTDDTYLSIYANALQIFQKNPVNLNDKNIRRATATRTLKEKGFQYAETLADFLKQKGYDDILFDVIDQDIFIGVNVNDGLQITTPKYGKNYRGEDAVMSGNPIAGLDASSISEIVKDLDAMSKVLHGEETHNYYLIERALLHAIIYLAKSATVFYIEALENGMIHLIDKTAAVASYFEDLGVRSSEAAGNPSKKIIVRGLERNGYTLDPNMVA